MFSRVMASKHVSRALWGATGAVGVGMVSVGVTWTRDCLLAFKHSVEQCLAMIMSHRKLE
jgi:hypothetical protein